jgi:AraC-like DNA-binding protein
MVMLMEPGETHRTVKLLAPTESFGVCHVDAQWMQRLAQAAGIRPAHFAVAALTHPGAYRELSAFLRAMAGGASLLERETRLILFVQAALRHGAEPGPATGGACDAPVNLRRARDWLVDNHDRKIVLDDLAGASGLSKFHLIRAFTRAYGMTPHVFLNHVRVSRARERLRLGEAVAGPELGFFDQSHFIQVFRRTVGTTPGHYAGIGHPLRT